MPTASSASGWISATRSEWNVSMPLYAFEVVEGLQARPTTVVGLARRGTKLAHPLGSGASATRTMNSRSMKQVARTGDGFLGRGYAICPEFAPAAISQPVARPGG